MNEYDEGSIGTGICLGLFLGFIGFIIAIAIGKPNTTKGVAIGFLISVVVEIIVTVAILVPYLQYI